jgi:hypothetical protein
MAIPRDAKPEHIRVFMVQGVPTGRKRRFSNKADI